MDEFTQRNQAIYWAHETHPNRFNTAEKPTPEDIIERAKKYLTFLLDEGVRE